jgi:hypothetical protein
LRTLQAQVDAHQRPGATTAEQQRIKGSGDAGSQYTSIAFAETLVLAGPLRTIDDVEYTTMEWVDWFGYAGNPRRVSRDQTW